MRYTAINDMWKLKIYRVYRVLSLEKSYSKSVLFSKNFNWHLTTQYNFRPLVDPKHVLLLLKNFVMPMNYYLKEIFCKFSNAELENGIFIISQSRKMI